MKRPGGPPRRAGMGFRFDSRPAHHAIDLGTESNRSTRLSEPRPPDRLCGAEFWRAKPRPTSQNRGGQGSVCATAFKQCLSRTFRLRTAQEQWHTTAIVKLGRAAWLVRLAFEELRGCGLDFGRRHVVQVSRDPPFVTERISHAGESFTPKHVRWLHDDFRTITFHLRHHRVTIIHVEMNSHGRGTQRRGAWRTAVLG